jgi:hypothetical protein
MAPNGIVGMVREFLQTAAPSGLNRRALAILLIASYVFLVGLGGVVIGLSGAMGAVGALRASLGVFVILLSLAYLAAAYGLLKHEVWSPLLITIVLAISIPLSFVYIWLDSSPANIIAHAVALVIDGVAIWYMQRREVTAPFRAMTEQQAAS